MNIAATKKFLLVVVVPVMAIGLGAALWWRLGAVSGCASSPTSRVPETPASAAIALKVAKAEELAALKELARIRESIEAARGSGDATKLKDAQDAERRAERVAREKATISARRTSEAATAKERTKEARRSAASASQTAQSCSG